MQLCVTVLLASAHRWLLGGVGLVSFGHALYFGAGAYGAALLTGLVAEWTPAALPALLWMPLCGVVVAVLTVLLLGWMGLAQGGMVFAMISLALGELAHATGAMLPGIFGDEGGLRVAGAIDSAPRALPAVLAWTLAGAWLLHRLGRTRLALVARGVRDNPERIACLGFAPARIRWQMMLCSAAVAGLAGALYALQHPRLTIELFGFERSGAILIAVVVGGVASPSGAVLGAMASVLFMSLLSLWTPAWALYYGLLFIAVVLAFPGGLASLPARVHEQAVRIGPRAVLFRLALLAAVCCVAIAVVEALYQRSGQSAPGLALTQVMPAWELACWVAGLLAGIAWWWRGAARSRASPPASPRGDLDGLDEPLWNAHRPEGQPSDALRSDDLAPDDLPPDAAPLLEVRDLSCARGGRSILGELSLQVQRGECVALVGPNGAGKSTLFDVLSGLCRIERGDIRLDGRSLLRRSPWARRRAGLSRSFQTSHLFPSIGDRDSLALAHWGATGASLWRAREARHDGADASGRPISRSVDDARMLELRLAIGAPARLVLLDEPTAGCSPEQVDRIIEWIRSRPEGLGVLLIEHDPQVARALADRVALMVDGRIVATGAVDEMLDGAMMHALHPMGTGPARAEGSAVREEGRA